MSVEETLAERETQHGSFKQHCEIEVALNMAAAPHAGHLTKVQKVAVGMILHKLARILNRGAQHSDTWHDIAGYATLAEKEILSQ